MSKTLRNTLIVLVVILGAAALLLVGMYFGRVFGSPLGFWSGNMMEAYDEAQFPYGMGPGMMGTGMMRAYVSNPLIDVEPLSLSAAEDALEDYLGALVNDDLTLGEVMIFDNHAYAQLIEESTGIGAMEVLINPVTGAVSPEFGPNMMWNLKYSPMAGSGMMGMMSGFRYSSQVGAIGGMMGGQTKEDLPTEMPVSADEAVQFAQRFLDTYIPGAEADEATDPFYGYYTLHINNDGSTVGMLSVNGYTGEVFLHTWHGDLIEMSETH
jgi:hypothetical protein